MLGRFLQPNAAQLIADFPIDPLVKWVDGRQIADFRHGISFGHQQDYPLAQFTLA